MARGGFNGLAAALLIAVTAVGVLSAPRATQARPLDTVMESGSITIGVYRDLPPYSFRDGGRLTGIDVDIGAELAERLGVSVSYLELTADENVDDDLRNGVWKGSVLGGGVADVMLHMPVDREVDSRNELAALFGAYHRESYVVAYDSRDVGDHPTLVRFTFDDLIGAELDSLPDFFLSSTMGGRILPNVRRAPTVEQAVARMVDGELAAVMGEETRLRAALPADSPEYRLAPMPMPGFSITAWDLGTAVKIDSRDLGYKVRSLLDDMATDGTLNAIFTRHGGRWNAPEH